jgi:hypothetical protein
VQARVEGKGAAEGAGFGWSMAVELGARLTHAVHSTRIRAVARCAAGSPPPRPHTQTNMPAQTHDALHWGQLRLVLSHCRTQSLPNRWPHLSEAGR